MRHRGARIQPLGGLALVVNLFTNRHFFDDDALIELRYASNLLRFGELGWNPGERVAYDERYGSLARTGACQLAFTYYRRTCPPRSPAGS